ncbi:MAG: CARDB domain-containing protein, partial [Chloroflexota bacterium]
TAPSTTTVTATSSLVARGIPAVVAMQFAISDGAAKAFAEEFYRAIAEMLPLDAATSEGRRAIANRVGNNEWGTPVLYLRSADGVLFQPASAIATTPPLSGAIIQPQPSGLAAYNSRIIAWGAVGIIALVLVFMVVRPILIPPVPPTATLTPTPSALPDLRIGRLRISPPNPAPGQIFILSIPITNAGDAPSGAFDWAWDASSGSPVMQNSLFGEIENIAPGASKNISFPFSYGWWGSYNSQLRVDIDTEVAERDERNNSQFLEVEMALLPFEVDFSLLPTNELTEPPLTFTDNLFSSWNLRFAVNADGQPDCANTPMALVESQADILLTAGGENPACQTLPLTINVLRLPVTGALVEIIPLANGTASFTYYADANGTQPIFQSPSINLVAGEVTTLSSDETGGQRIRRMDVSVPGQMARLTRLLLSPPEG